jgi:hypothetical protein
MTLTARRLRKLTHYDKLTGYFFWKVGGFKKRIGRRAGGANKQLGYWLIGLDGKRYYAHDLAWLYVYGKWPKRIEFINGQGLDTSIINLREKRTGTIAKQAKICPICSNDFQRNHAYSNRQWTAATFCSKKCAQESKRRANSKKRPCRRCGNNGPFHTYTTSGGHKSRRKLCRKCFNAERIPKRGT